ncbi:IS3 family transposase [Wukongibacter baidiensis]|uniref:IS3 family transposase n=1 Tax=Wukongibacter baidiensis TaxID=1723361 RepID=UPI003D7F27A3
MLLELDYPICLLCEIAGVSRSSYYRYKNKPLNRSTKIDKLIIDIYNKSNKRAGYRSIKAILKNQYGLTVNHKKVQRIMRENNIHSIVRRKFRKPKDKSIIKENVLNRDFSSPQPGKKFVTDITYIPTRRKMIYLCTVIDLFNNEPVAWNISDSQDKNLSIDTIKLLSKKFDLKGSIIHSDQGVHYTSNAYVDLLKELEVIQSMSRKGNCWDNAKAESFFSHYKCETIHIMNKKIKDLHDVKQITEEYMNYYINARPQKNLGGLPPSIYKKKHLCS